MFSSFQARIIAYAAMFVGWGANWYLVAAGFVILIWEWFDEMDIPDEEE